MGHGSSRFVRNVDEWHPPGSLPLEHPIDGYVSRPLPPGRQCMPLHEFPLEHARRLVQQALSDEKPSRYITLMDGMVQLSSRAWYEWHWHRGIDPDKQRPRMETWLRLAVIERDGYVCGLCAGDVEPTDVHIDHIMPRSRGGGDEMDNLQVSHSTCNIRKGANV